MQKKSFYLLILLISYNIALQARQSDSTQMDLVKKGKKEKSFPEVGKPIPGFNLTNLEYYPVKEVSGKDLKGKFVILDFWTRHCRSCIRSFPKINTLRKQFRDRLELFLVTPNSGKFYAGTREVYEKYRERHNLDIPISYSDHLPDQFGITTVPHLIWIDDKGIVQAISTSESLTPENIEAFLNKEKIDFRENLNEDQVKEIKLNYDSHKPLLIAGNGGDETDFLFRSVLSEGNLQIKQSRPGYFRPPSSQERKQNIALQMTIAPLKRLYQVAYGDTLKNDPIGYDIYPNCYGKYWYEPILEVRDSTAFIWDIKTRKNTYCYSLMVPDDRLTNIIENQRIVQRDLKNYFGYDISVEIRKMPYWAIKATDKAKRILLTKGEQPSFSGNGLTHMKYVNQSIGNSVLYLLWSDNQLGPPFIDETGITGNIDITLDTILTEFDALRKELEKNGLLLEKKEKEMKVIVIRDPKEGDAI